MNYSLLTRVCVVKNSLNEFIGVFFFSFHFQSAKINGTKNLFCNSERARKYKIRGSLYIYGIPVNWVQIINILIISRGIQHQGYIQMVNGDK